MELILLASTFLLVMGTLGLMLRRGFIGPVRLLGWAFLLCGVASFAWCADLTATAATVMAFDLHHVTVQSVSLLILAVGACTIGYFGGVPLEAVLEHYLMDHISAPQVKVLVPLVFSLLVAMVTSLSTGLSFAASIPAAILMWSKSLSVHASEAGTVSAAAADKAIADAKP